MIRKTISITNWFGTIKVNKRKIKQKRKENGENFWLRIQRQKKSIMKISFQQNWLVTKENRHILQSVLYTKIETNNWSKYPQGTQSFSVHSICSIFLISHNTEERSRVCESDINWYIWSIMSMSKLGSGSYVKTDISHKKLCLFITLLLLLLVICWGLLRSIPLTGAGTRSAVSVHTAT